MAPNIIQVKMVDKDIIDRVASHWSVSSVLHRAARRTWQDTWRACMRGDRAVTQMSQLYPLMGQRRQQRIASLIPAQQLGSGGIASWEEIGDEFKLVWLAGLLEGEGSFIPGPPSAANRPQMQIEMVDEDIIARVATMFDVSYHQGRPATPTRQQTFVVCKRGRKAIALMQSLRPWMGVRRTGQIDKSISSHNPNLRPGGRQSELDRSIVLDIYNRACSGENYGNISNDYSELGVTRNTVKDIKRGQSWGWLTGAGKSL